MFKHTTINLSLIAVPFFMVLWLSGCASIEHSQREQAPTEETQGIAPAMQKPALSDEQEGGISGTGNSIDCTKKRNHEKPECLQQP